MNRSFVLGIAVLCFIVCFVKGKNTIHCTFEKDSCEWKEVKTKNCWLMSKPNEHLFEMTGFMYFNKSCSSGEVMTKPLSSLFSESEEEFHFWYYMHGKGDGELTIVDHDAFGPIFGNPPHMSFHCRGDRGQQWQHAHVKIPGGTMFMGIKAKTRGDFFIAVDNITADSHGAKVPSEHICPRLTTSKQSTASPTKRQVKTSRPTSIKQATTTKRLIIDKETTTKRNSQPMRTKSTTRVATKLNTLTTMSSPELHTNMAMTTETPGEVNMTRNNSFSDHDYDVSSFAAKKEKLRNISTIFGACIGGLLLVIGVILAGYLTYRRIRLKSMYSFKKRTLNEENADVNIRGF